MKIALQSFLAIATIVSTLAAPAASNAGARDTRTARIAAACPVIAHDVTRRIVVQNTWRTLQPLGTARGWLLGLLNAERAAAGAAALRCDAALDAIAQWRSQDMLARHYFSHQIPGVGFVFSVLDRNHIMYDAAGENIALNNYITITSLCNALRQTNRDLLNSPEHRTNILDRTYSEVGLGIAVEPGSGKLIVTQVFVHP